MRNVTKLFLKNKKRLLLGNALERVRYSDVQYYSDLHSSLTLIIRQYSKSQNKPVNLPVNLERSLSRKMSLTQNSMNLKNLTRNFHLKLTLKQNLRLNASLDVLEAFC